MQKLKIVSMVKINGTWVNQDDIDTEEFKKMIEIKMDTAMQNIGFERIKTA